jgi:hypothetical protein
VNKLDVLCRVRDYIWGNMFVIFLMGMLVLVLTIALIAKALGL